MSKNIILLPRKYLDFLIDFLSSKDDESNSERKILRTNLFFTYFMITIINSMSTPIKDSLILPWGKSLQSGIMVLTPFLSILSQFVVATGSSNYGPDKLLIMILCSAASIFVASVVAMLLFRSFEIYFVFILSLFISVFVNISASLFWYVLHPFEPLH